MPDADATDAQRLQAEVDELRQRLDRREVWSRWRQRGRRGLVGLLVFLFSFGVVFSLIGVWADRTALETDRFVETVAPLPADPDVRRALADFITTELFVELDLDERAREALPDNLRFLVGPLEGIVRDYTRDAIDTVLASEQFQRVWNDGVTTAHQLALNVLDGDDPPGVERRDGEVVLDLLPAIHEILQRLIEQGPGFLGDVELPDLDSDATRREIRRSLSEQFGVDLPQDFGELVVFHEDRLSEASDAVHLAERFVILAVVLTVVFGIGALLLSMNRRRTLLQLGLGVAIATYVTFAILRVVVDDLVNLVEEGDDRTAAAAAAAIVARGLRDRAWYVLIGGVVVAVGAYLAGPGRGAVWIRRNAVALARRARAGADVGAGALSGTAAGRWVTTNLDALRIGGLVAALALLLLVDHTWTGVVVVVLILGAYEGGLILYARRSTPEPEAAAPE